MRTFAQFFESNNKLILPSDNTTSLSRFLDTLVGSSIKSILDKSSYVNIYMGNKYGFSDMDAGDKAVKDFAQALLSFVNRDILKHRPTDREYETSEFKKAHNYDEYDKLNKERVALFRSLIGKAGEERNAIYKQKMELEDRIANTEYSKAVREANNRYEQAVNKYHNKPLTKEDLQDDGSKEYRDLERAFENLVASRAQPTDNIDDGSYIDV
jgi:hypothetical protein